MVFLTSNNFFNNTFSLFFWIVLFIVATCLFIYFIHQSYDYFYLRKVRIHFKKDEKERVKIYKIRIGKEVLLNELETFKDIDLNEYDLKVIKSNSLIEEGSLKSFKMPNEDVDVYYEFKDRKDEEKEKERTRRYYLNLPRSIKDLEEKAAIPVVLITLDDVKEHLRNTNRSFLFPLINNYQIASKDPYEVLVCYIDKVIYAVVCYSEVTFKMYFRCDSQYVKDHLSHVASISHIDKDIYSLVVDSSFYSYAEVMYIFDHSYHYTLDMAFDRRNAITYKLQVDEEAYNSELLQIVEYLPKEFDPVFEKTQLEAKRYKEYLDMLKSKERKLDEPIESERKKLYEILENLEEYIAPIQKDQYISNFTFEGNQLEQEPSTRDKSMVVEEIPDIADEIIDIYITNPSKIKIENVVDYIVSRNEMPNLTMSSGDFTKNTEPTTLKYLSSYFAILFKNKNKFRIATRQDRYVIRELIKTHPNIINVRNGNETDWYTMLIDDTYTSYQELYSILLSSYNYTKAEHYKKSKNERENNLLKLKK